MKVVLSRKGFDASAGRVASPILADGRMVPLPKPDKNWDRRTFGETVVNGVDIGPLVETRTGGRLKRSDHCHLDPQLEGPFKGYGAAGNAKFQLARHDIKAGDLFLFFGWFQHEGSAGPGFHALFGWLLVSRVHERPHLADSPLDHPHARQPLSGNSWAPENTIYEGTNAGLFGLWSEELLLTAPGSALRSYWRLPQAFSGANLSFHSRTDRWHDLGKEGVGLQTVGRGQEFVTDSPAVAEWALRLIRHARPIGPSR